MIVYLRFVIVDLGCDCVFETSRCLGDQALSPGGPTGHRHPSTSLQKLLGDADDDDDVTDDVTDDDDVIDDNVTDDDDVIGYDDNDET